MEHCPVSCVVGLAYLPAHKDEEHIDIAWRHPRDAACLGKCFWLNLHQFLAAFGGEALEGCVVKVASYADVLQAVHLFGYDALAFDVALVFHSDLGGFGYFFFSVGRSFQYFFQLGDDFCQILQVELRTAYEVCQLAAELEWGSAEGFEGGVDKLRFDGEIVAEVFDFFDVLFFSSHQSYRSRLAMPSW